MNREIKFRAWIQVGDKGQMFFPSRMHYHAEDSKYCKKGFSATDPATSFVSYDVMQFTGLKDKNGVEIYEGDILLIDGDGGIRRRDVKFEQGGFVVYDDYGDFDVTTIGWAIEIWRDGEGADHTVIGNIYENPELLKEAK